MNRRRTLHLSCCGLLSLLAGCSDFGSRAPTMHEVGESFVVGSTNPIEYRVNLAIDTDQMPNVIDGFVFVEVEFENLATQALDIYPELFSLSAAGGSQNEYVRNETATLVNPLEARALQPNESGVGELLYPVPDADVFYLLVEPVRPVEPTPVHRVRLDNAL
jgi:hypothetical protein